jgi:hypothetical protein
MSKYICYIENKNTSINKEFFKFDFENRIINGLHAPMKATQFKTKKEAKKATEECYTDRYGLGNMIITNEIKALEDEFNDWVENGAIYRKLFMKSSFSRPYNNEDKQSVLEWWVYYYKNEGSISFEDFKTWPHPSCFYKCITDVINMVNSNHDYIAPTVVMRVSNDCDFETFKHEFEIAKKIVEFKTDGFFKMEIRENSLCEFGMYHLDYNDETYNVIFNKKVIETFDNLETLFQFWKKRLPYSTDF